MKNAKRIIAIVAIILLVLLYVVTLVVAIVDTSATKIALQVCLIGTVVVPVFAWGGIWLFGSMTGKKTMADLHMMQDEKEYLEDTE